MIRRALVGAPALWVAFALVHLRTAYVGVIVLRVDSFYDVELYRRWVQDGLVAGRWPVLDVDWVYPFGALAPMLAVAPWSGSALGYAIAWAALVTALNAGAVVVLLRTTPRGLVGAWWWVGATLLLGPIALGRIDGVVAPLMVVALAVAVRRPLVAAALLTIGAWLKVAPGAIVLALAATARSARAAWRDVVLPAALVSAAVVGAALAGGAGTRVAGFLGAQGTRGLQIEAVAATPYSLARAWDPTIWAELNVDLNTFEIGGRDTTGISRYLDVALVLAVAGIVALAWRARHGASLDDDDGGLGSGDDGALQVLLLAAFALELALIVFNKVGSPQYISWLLPPVAVALGAGGWVRPWRVPALALLVVTALTQWLFPMAYVPFLNGFGPVLVAEAARNVLLVALLAWAVAELWRAAPGRGPGHSVAEAPAARIAP